MSVGNLTLVFISAVTTLAALATVMTWLGFSINGRKHVARMWAWFQKPRTEREALKRRIGELDKHINLLSALVQTQSKMRDAEHRELELLVADLKQRADRDGESLTNAVSNIAHDALELDALGTKQKQLEAQLEEYGKALFDVRVAIAGLQRDDLKIYKANGATYRSVNDRLRKLEGLPPSGYIGQVPLSNLPDPDDTAEPF